jgi:hypothetical protein
MCLRAKANALRPQGARSSGRLQPAGRDASQVAPVLWAGVDALNYQ